MLAYTYIKQGKFELIEKPKPELKDTRDAIVRVTLSSICTSDLHIKHGGVPRAVPGVTIGHEMVGVVEQTGADVTLVKPGDRVVVNVETFCGKCFFCQHGYVNITAQVRECSYFSKGIALGGYCFDFSDVLKRYFVKQYGNVAEYYAIDKTSLRTMLYGRIQDIVEVN